MKKLFALLLALMMVLSLAACGGGDDEKTPSSDDKTPSSTGQQEQNTPDPGTNEPDNSGEAADPGTSGNAGSSAVADANAYLAERGFDGFTFPEDLTVAEMELMDSPATIAGRVEVTFCPVEKDKYEEILTALFSGTGMTALDGTNSAAASPDDCLSNLSTDEYIEHRFTFQEPDWNYSVTVAYCPNGGEHGLYGTIEAKTLFIDIQHGTKK